MIRAALALCLSVWVGPAAAFELAMPTGARLISERDSAFDSYDLPVGPWADGRVAVTTFEGRIERDSWRVDGSALTTLQILDILRSQLADAGYETVFECNAPSCGGFDFRFAIEVIPTPDMYVDIRDYRFLAARTEDAALSILVSRSRSSGYVQVIHAGQAEAGSLRIAAPAASPKPSENPPEPGSLSAALLETGHVVLSDLDFSSGTAELNGVDYGSLTDLAEFLGDNQNARIALVGHTDATGALDVNIDLSRARAEAVRVRLLERYGIAPERIDAEGMGYLAPFTTNLTTEGRALNRRVEAVLLTLE